MNSTTMLINPLGGSRASFVVPIEAGLYAGNVLMLRTDDAPNPRHGLLVLVESCVPLHDTQLSRAAEPNGHHRRRLVGTIDVLAVFDGSHLLAAPQALEDGSYWTALPDVDVLKKYYGTVRAETVRSQPYAPALDVGSLLQNTAVPVLFASSGFGRHSAMFAQSGSGKSYSMGVLLEELVVKATIRLIVIDPNGDYLNIGSIRDSPGWPDDVRSVYGSEMKSMVFASPGTVDEAEQATDRCLQEHHRGVVLNLNRTEFQIWGDIVAGVVNRLWKHRNEKVPTLIIIDEAHHFAPAMGASPSRDTAHATLLRIAAEGRKFGLWLFLATQRPLKLDDNIISQCDNLFVMKLTSRADTEHIARAYNAVSAEMVALAYGFRQGDALAVGRVVKSPTLLHFRTRNTLEGGADLPNDWILPPGSRL
jgi:hypothetical protein